MSQGFIVCIFIMCFVLITFYGFYRMITYDDRIKMAETKSLSVKEVKKINETLSTIKDNVERITSRVGSIELDVNNIKNGLESSKNITEN